MEPCEVGVRCSIPGGNFYLLGVSLSLTSETADQENLVLTRCTSFWDGDYRVSILSLLTVWLHGHWGCCVRRDGRAQRERWEWPRSELAPDALQPVLCSSHTPLEHEMLLQ